VHSCDYTGCATKLDHFLMFVMPTYKILYKELNFLICGVPCKIYELLKKAGLLVTLNY